MSPNPLEEKINRKDPIMTTGEGGKFARVVDRGYTLGSSGLTVWHVEIDGVQIVAGEPRNWIELTNSTEKTHADDYANRLNTAFSKAIAEEVERFRERLKRAFQEIHEARRDGGNRFCLLVPLFEDCLNNACKLNTIEIRRLPSSSGEKGNTTMAPRGGEKEDHIGKPTEMIGDHIADASKMVGDEGVNP